MWVQGIEPGFSEEQAVLLTAESSLQPPERSYSNLNCNGVEEVRASVGKPGGLPQLFRGRLKGNCACPEALLSLGGVDFGGYQLFRYVG